jgi:DNA-binding transcriptional MerR regulator
MFMIRIMMRDSRLYTQNEVNRIFAHVNKRTLLVWAERGLVETASENIDGRGRNRIYSRANILQIALVERMAALNFSFETIKEIMEHLIFKLSKNGKPNILELLEKKENLIIDWTLKGEKKTEPKLFTSGQEGEMDPLQIRNIYEIEIIMRLPIIANRIEQLIKDAGLDG